MNKKYKKSYYTYTASAARENVISIMAHATALIIFIGFLLLNQEAYGEQQCHDLDANNMGDFVSITSEGGKVCINLKGLVAGNTFIQVDRPFNPKTSVILGYDVLLENSNGLVYSKNIFSPDSIDLAKLDIGNETKAKLILSNAQNKDGYTYTYNIINSKETAFGISIISIAVIVEPTIQPL